MSAMVFHCLTIYHHCTEANEMIDMTGWMELFLRELHTNFGDRVWFTGLQGSYGRGEATETSDIDLVVILDELTVPDIQSYSRMLDTLPHRESICGFLAGKNELLHWDTADLFQFCHDTKAIRGSLDEVLAQIDSAAVERAVKRGVCDLYHGCVHNMLYEKSEEILKGLYKSASFVIQAICFQQTGTYVSRQQELLDAVGEEEQAVIRTFLKLKHGGAVDFEEMSGRLFRWARGWMGRD